MLESITFTGTSLDGDDKRRGGRWVIIESWDEGWQVERDGGEVESYSLSNKQIMRGEVNSSGRNMKETPWLIGKTEGCLQF